MHISSTIIAGLGLFAQLSTAVYTLQDDYGRNGSFFDSFNFYTGTDPTNGFVDYLDRWTATKSGLVSHQNGAVYIGVENKNISSAPGRQSVRLESTRKYTRGLVILDLAHMPGSVCGSWPAFWMLGSNWPSNGEIDIIEGVNDQTTNQMTLHTADGCAIEPLGFTGNMQTPNCFVEAEGQAPNSGCAISSNHDSSYGDGFNKAGGGVYATEWTGQAINVWFFPNSSVPWDIRRGRPNPSRWGTPSARFAEPCNIDSHFNELQIVFDITFCGDWAGAVWSTSNCASKASTCNAFVQDNPSAFTETYWHVNSLKVYQETNPSLLDIDINLPIGKPKVDINAALPIDLLTGNTQANAHAAVPDVHNGKTKANAHAAVPSNVHNDNTQANAHTAVPDVHNDKTKANIHAAIPTNVHNNKQVNAHAAVPDVHNHKTKANIHAAIPTNVHNNKQVNAHAAVPDVHNDNAQANAHAAVPDVHNGNTKANIHAVPAEVQIDNAHAKAHAAVPANVHNDNTQANANAAVPDVHNENTQVNAHGATPDVHNDQTKAIIHPAAPVLLPGSMQEMAMMNSLPRLSSKHRRELYRHGHAHKHAV